MGFQISDKFNLYFKDKITEKSTKAYFYEHKKTKAKILFYDCENVNAAFGIYFKTPVSDSSGITHILEHSVFEGSRKYHERGNLDYLINNSLSSILNAATFQDRTMYYFSSSFKKDYLNVMDIYLDFVFFPKLEDTTFKREGFFYKKENGKWEFNGIVFNEMKDSLLGYDRKNYFDTLKHLFPNSTYSHLQGGDPVEIVDLTLHDIKKYHEEYYHPSNSYTIIYGKIDKKKVFEKLDEYFSEFDFKDIKVNHELTSLAEPKKVTDYYQNYLDDGLVSYSKSIVFDKVSFEEELVFYFLVDLLFKYEFSPMKRVLEDSGLVSNISSVYFDNDNSSRVPYFKLDFRGVEEKNIEKINILFEKNIKKLTKKIDPEIKKAVFKKFEFSAKEFNFYEGQGVNYIMDSSTKFMTEENPVESYKTLKILKILRKYLKGKKLENFLKIKFVNNPRTLDTILKPSANLIDNYKKELEIKLEERMKLIDTTKLEKEVNEFEKWRDAPKKEVKYTDQKKIKPKDLEVDLIKYNSKYEDRIFKTIVPSEDIVRLELDFDYSKVDMQKLEYLAIYLYVLYYLSSENYNFEKFNLEKSKFLSNFSVSSKSYKQRNSKDIYLMYFISFKYLREDFDNVLNILDELFYRSKFNEKERMKFLIAEFNQILKDGADNNFRQNAMTFLGQFISPTGDFNEGIRGLSLNKKIEKIVKNFDQEYPNLVSELESIHQKIISSKMIINLGTSEKFAKANFSDVQTLVKKLKLNLVDKKDLGFYVNQNYHENHKDMNFFHEINSDTNFNFAAIKYNEFPEGKFSQLKFVSEYLSQHLFEKIRLNHGAYGARGTINTFDSYSLLTSWSDPQIQETFKTFLNFSKNYDLAKFNNKKFEKIKMQLLSRQKQILSNGEIFRRSFDNFMTGVTYKMREEDLLKIKTLNYTDFKELFKLIKNPKYIIKFICSNKENITNFKEKYTEVKA